MNQIQHPRPANPAEAYELALVKRVFQPLAQHVLRMASPETGACVLDVATGTGICLREAAPLVGNTGRLVGLDVNPIMIEVGRSIAEQSGIQIEWHHGDAGELPFSDAAFDWVYCQQGLQFFHDRVAALTEMHRVLDENGRAVISVWQSLESHPYSAVIDEAGYRHTGEHLLRSPTGPFSLGDPEELARLVEQAGFRDIQITPVSFIARADDALEVLRTDVAAAVAVLPALQRMEPEQRATLIDNMVKRLEALVDRFIEHGALVNEWHANVVIAKM